MKEKDVNSVLLPIPVSLLQQYRDIATIPYPTIVIGSSHSIHTHEMEVEPALEVYKEYLQRNVRAVKVNKSILILIRILNRDITI